MKKLIALLLSAVIVTAFAGCGSMPESSSGAAVTEEIKTSETLAEDIKNQMDEALSNIDFDGVAQITRRGEVIYQYVEGDDDNGRPLTIASSLPIGSVSKQFCAASVMLLCDKYSLSTDDTLDKFFPEYEYGKKITVRHLLTMSSGIPDYYPMFMDASELGADEAENVRTIKEVLFEKELGFEPGEKYEYSNSNYFLLADIVEQVSGEPYHDHLRKTLLEPLGMTDTGFVEEIAGDHAWTSALSKTELMNETTCPGLAKGAGDIVSNAADMDKWMRGLCGGEVISSDVFQKMTEGITSDGSEEYSCGLWEMAYGGVGHSGRIPPHFSAVDYLNSDRGVYLFAASNAPSGSSFMEQIPNMLLDILLEDK